MSPLWALLVQVIVVPLLTGAVGALWGGSAVAGRRIARLAAVSAGLGLFLYGTIAVAVLGAGGPPEDTGWTVSYIVGDRLGNNAVFYLWFFPLTTAAIAWAAAASTARIHPRLVTSTVPVPFTAAGGVGEGSRDPVAALEEAGRAARVQSWRRTAWLLLLCAVVAATLVLVGVS